MTPEVHERATATLIEIIDLCEDYPDYAFKLMSGFRRCEGHLPTHPDLFPIFYDRPSPPPPRRFRRAIISDYAIVYVVVPERAAVLIVDYWHTARDGGALRSALDQLTV